MNARAPMRLCGRGRVRAWNVADVAAETIEAIRGNVRAIALYIMPNGDILRVCNPQGIDPDCEASLVGVYDRDAMRVDVIEDIHALEAMR